MPVRVERVAWTESETLVRIEQYHPKTVCKAQLFASEKNKKHIIIIIKQRSGIYRRTLGSLDRGLWNIRLAAQSSCAVMRLGHLGSRKGNLD